VAVHATCYLRVSGQGLAADLIAVAAFVLSALLAVGLFTPISGAVIIAGALAIRFSWLPHCPGEVLDSWIAVVLEITVLVATIGLGPGAFSIDARLFGRREIIIPPSSWTQR
jgi:uncharacterized membrane protein YphA (DoxX/SURF4 family)